MSPARLQAALDKMEALGFDRAAFRTTPQREPIR
jgi:hypothetical protein